MLQVWKEGGGRGALPIEVERWEVVKEDAGDPVSLKEFSDTEKKVCANTCTRPGHELTSNSYMQPP